MNLALFFTRNTSLKTWVDTGLFFREKLLYEYHLNNNNLDEVYWYTYGENDERLAKRLKADDKLDKRIIVKQMPSLFKGKLGSWLYSILLPFIHSSKLREINIFKSNQMDGAWTPMICSLFYNGLYYLRTGYTLSIFSKRQSRSKLIVAWHRLIEKVCYRAADISAVSSEYDKNYVIENYRPTSNVEILYNFIDTDMFKDQKLNRKNELVFIGRFNEQKNLFNTIDAALDNNIKINLYGAGELEDVLKNKYKNNNNVEFNNKIPNDQVPNILNNYKYYILASHYEGMPKSLIEAMSCGNICIGTNVEGINELLSNTIGFVCDDCSKNSIAKTIKNAKETKDSKNLINRSKEKILKDFSIVGISNRERYFLSSKRP